MSVLSIQPTFPIFTDIDGQPLENGYIFIGQANQNPITNPISVFFNIGLTVLAAQPIRTIGGYPANAGTPGRLYVNSDYSIQVQNKNGSVVYSAPTATEQYSSVVVNNLDFSSLTASTALALDASKNIISVTNTGTGNNVLATSPALIGLRTDTISELTAAAGVTMLNGLRTDTILERTAAAGVTVDGVLLKDTTVTANTVKASGTASSQGTVEFFENTNNGTNFIALQAPASVGSDRVITFPDATTTVVGTDTTQTLTNKTIQGGAIASATAQASTSGTSIDFTGIPAYVKRITVMFNEVSLNGTSSYLVQIGSGSFSTSGYVSTCNGTNQSNTTGGINSTSGFCLRASNASGVTSGHMVITLISSNTYIESLVSKNATTEAQWGGGSSPNLAGVLDRVRITTVNGTDTFDAGSINILFE